MRNVSTATSRIDASHTGTGRSLPGGVLRAAQPRAGRDPNARTTGSALLGSALTTALGFGVLVFSPLAGFRQFGVTAAITIAYSLIVSILVVPPAMTVWGAYQNMSPRVVM